MQNTTEYTKETIKTLVRNGLSRAMSYSEYRELMAHHVAVGTNTGDDANASYAQFTQLNHSRMKRLDKTITIPEEVTKKFENFTGQQDWLVLTESWCGDAAQSMPIMQKLAELASGIRFSVLLRDENPELMNAFLTNGAMSIPKLIVYDRGREEVVADWGSKPSVATTMVAEFKSKHGALTPEFKKNLQVWYNKDKGASIIKELSEIIH